MKLEELYEKYKYMFTGFAYRHLSDKALAEDIVQDVFTILCRRDYIDKIESMEEKVAVRYVLKSIDNRIVSYRRSKQANFELTVLDDMREDKAAQGEAVWQNQTVIAAEEIVIANEKAKEAIMNVIEILGDEKYQMLRDVYFEGIPKETVANKLGITIETLRARLSRSRKLLKDRTSKK